MAPESTNPTPPASDERRAPADLAAAVADLERRVGRLDKDIEQLARITRHPHVRAAIELLADVRAREGIYIDVIARAAALDHALGQVLDVITAEAAGS